MKLNEIKEKTIRMMIYYVLACCEKEKQTIESCIGINKLLIAMVKNEETKADRLLNLFPNKHPVKLIYDELREREDLLELLENSKEKLEKTTIENNYLRNIEDDKQVIDLSNKIAE